MQTPTCLHCNETMRFIGRKTFHEGTRWGALGDLFELFVNKESFYVYHCQNCGKVEFYVPPNAGPTPTQRDTGADAERDRIRAKMDQYAEQARRKS